MIIRLALATASLCAASVFGASPMQALVNEEHNFSDGLTIQLIEFRRGYEGGLPHAAWSVEVVNRTGGDVPMAPMSSCLVGEPLKQAGQPVLGTRATPPDVLPSGESASWRDGCRMGMDETRFQYTVTLLDTVGKPLYPEVSFIGTMPE